MLITLVMQQTRTGRARWKQHKKGMRMKMLKLQDCLGFLLKRELSRGQCVYPLYNPAVVHSHVSLFSYFYTPIVYIKVNLV